MYTSDKSMGYWFDINHISAAYAQSGLSMTSPSTRDTYARSSPGYTAYVCSRGYEMCPIPEEMWRISCHEVEPIQGGNTPNIQTLEHLVNK